MVPRQIPRRVLARRRPPEKIEDPEPTLIHLSAGMAQIDRKLAPAAGKPKPTASELEKLEARFSAARAEPGALIQLSHLVDEEDADSRWPNRIFEDRDCSGIGDEIAASIGQVTETIVDGTSYSLGSRQDDKHDFRTVSVHVCSEGAMKLLALERGDERSGAPVVSPTPVALRAGLEIAQRHGKDLASAPLIGLEPELVNSEERRLLIAKGFSYVMRAEEGAQFSHIQWRPEEQMDALEPLPISCIFDVRCPVSDQSRVSIIATRDLADQRPSASGRFREHLVRIFRHDEPPLYFVARAGSPDGADERERRRRAGILALRAALLMSAPPAREMRIHQFHHPRLSRYREVLQAVNRRRLGR